MVHPGTPEGQKPGGNSPGGSICSRRRLVDEAGLCHKVSGSVFIGFNLKDKGIGT